MNPFNLTLSTMLANSKPAPPSSFTEQGVDNQDSGWLQFPARIPDTEHFLFFMSLKHNDGQRGNILAFADAAAAQGWKANNSNSTGFINPRFDFPANGFSVSTFQSSANYAIGDRLNILISGTCDGGGGAVTKAVVWDETSGTGTTVVDDTAISGAIDYDFDASFTGQNMALFASGLGGRLTNVTNYRVAYWDLSSAPPDIALQATRDNLFNNSTGVLVDPATGNAAYGTPLYDIYGDVANYTAGTNLGSGSNFTVTGTFANE